MRASALLLALALSPALADEPAEPTEPADTQASASESSSEPVFSTDLRGEYLAGLPVLVTVRVANPGKSPLAFPNLAKRPYLVRFEITPSGGRSRTWSNTKPAEPPSSAWSIAPSSWRDTLMEIPSSSRLAPGSYDVVVEIRFDDTEDAATHRLPAHPIVVRRAEPVALDPTVDLDTMKKVGHQLLFVHKGSEGHQLYLRHSEPSDPRATRGTYFLTDLPEAAEPRLARSKPSSGWSRHAYWKAGANAIGVVQLAGRGRAGESTTFRVPYPSFELVGTGYTDTKSVLHVPIWIPSPDGRTGDLRILTWKPRERSELRKVMTQTKPLDQTATTIDGSGSLRLAVVSNGALVQYLIDTRTPASLPARGKRMFLPEKGEIAALAYQMRPTTESARGGLSLFVLQHTAVEQERALAGHWFGLDGSDLGATPPVMLPPDHEILQVLPRGVDTYDVLLRDKAGRTVLLPSDGKPVPLSQGDAPTLVSDAAGAVWLRTLVAKAVARYQPIHQAD